MRSTVLVVIAVALLHGTPANAATCESLASLKVTNGRVTSAVAVAPGAFTPPAGVRPGGPPPARAYATLPAFCRVAATLTPSADSDIKIEVWLPEPSKWNGKFEAVGNGGWAGVISYPALADALAGGYATASTDTGHVGNTASFAIGHPEKVTDLAYRAVHEMTVQAKAVLDAYYGRAAKVSFWNGCSFGGRQGITEALRYPADFDAIVAGAPAVNWMNLHVGRTALNVTANRTTDAIIPASKYQLVHDAALAACDARDGVKDGVITNPMSCRFDPSVLACKAGQDPNACLTAPQVAAAKALYSPVKNPKTGEVVVPGLEPGSELSFGTLGGATPVSTALDGEKYIIHHDPNWDFHTFSLSADLDAAHRADPGDGLASSSTNLKPFFARGGKLLMYHGFQDPQIPPENTINYYGKVVAGSGKGLAGTQIALYMVPGMNHCGGGPGTDVFDKMGAIESWVSSGKAPESIPAAHRTNGVVDRTRPLCQYPKVAKWNGKGSSDDAANFSCVADVSSTQAVAVGDTTTTVVAAANAFLATLSPAQRAAGTFAFNSPQRTGWSNLPTGIFQRKGLRLGDLSAPQRAAALAVVSAALSPEGYRKVTDIMNGDEVLKGEGGGRTGGRQGRGGIRFGLDEYYIALLGTPSTRSPWLLQFGGHHLAINVTIVGTQSVMTPSLPAAQPARYVLNGQTIRPLGKENDKGFALVNALDANQRRQAILPYKVDDLVLGPGEDGRTIMPEGLRAASMTPKQQEMLLDLAHEWVGILNEPAANAKMAELKANLGQTWFAWSGPTTNGSVAYFRIQGPTVVIEYAPQQGDLMHVHTIYRDPTNDYGARLAK